MVSHHSNEKVINTVLIPLLGLWGVFVCLFLLCYLLGLTRATLIGIGVALSTIIWDTHQWLCHWGLPLPQHTPTSNISPGWDKALWTSPPGMIEFLQPQSCACLWWLLLWSSRKTWKMTVPLGMCSNGLYLLYLSKWEDALMMGNTISLLDTWIV